jgi:glycosyltransferase involved in cell wall biosynthesis
VGVAPLNVLCVSLTDMLNGAERVMLDLASRLDVRQYRPVIAVPAPGPVTRAAAAHDIQTVVVPAPRWLPFAHDPAPAAYHWRRYWSESAAYVDPLVDVINRCDIDIVYSASSTILHGALAALLTGRPHVHHVQEVLGNQRLGLLMPRGDARAAYQIIGRLATRVVLIGRTSQRDVGQAIPAAKLRLVPLGFESPEPTPAMPLPTSEARVRVGLAGGVWRPKGTDLLPSIVRTVCETEPGVHFYWAGPGDREMMDRLQSECVVDGAPHLHFVGCLENIWPFLRAIDFLLHPSHSECFPRVLVEAALVHKASIATRCGGPEEIVEHGVSGLLAPVGDAGQLATDVISLSRDPERGQRMGTAAATRVAHLTMNAFVTGMENVLADAHAAGAVASGPLMRRFLSGLLHTGAHVVPAARALRASVGGRA